MNKKLKKYLPYLLYLTLAVIIMLPAFSAGYLFFLDMVWAPDIQLSDYTRDGISAAFPITLLLKALSLVISTAILQKILLLSIFFLSASAMFIFARRYLDRTGAFIAGLFYMINPYVYERFLAGHWHVLMGYAYFPLVINSFLRLLDKPGRASFWRFCILFALYPIISQHWFYMAFFVLLAVALAYLLKGNKWKIFLNKLFYRFVGVFLLIFLALNSFWLFSFWGEKSVWPRITLNDFSAFATSADIKYGAWLNVLSLYGFWNNIHILPKDIFGLWWLLTIAVFAVSLLGLIRLFKKQRLAGLVLPFVFLTALMIGVGYASGFTKPLVDMFFDYLPGFRGLRETAKAVGLIAFVYALALPLGGYALAGLAKKSADKIKRYIIYPGLIALIFLINFGIFNAFNGQLAAYEYPAGWAKVENYLSKNAADSKVLIMPWHGYPRLNFAGNTVVANPAKAFFSAKVIAGRNLDNVFLLETEQGKYDRLLLRLVQGLETVKENKDFLYAENISHIVLLKIDDYDRYGFLAESAALELIYEDETIALYRIN